MKAENGLAKLKARNRFDLQYGKATGEIEEGTLSLSGPRPITIHGNTVYTYNITGGPYSFIPNKGTIVNTDGTFRMKGENGKVDDITMEIQLTNLITTCLIESNRNNREEVKKCIKDKYEINNGLHSLPSKSYTSVMDTLQKKFNMNDREMASLYRIFANKHTLFYTRETLKKKADSYDKPWGTSRSGGTRRAKRN